MSKRLDAIRTKLSIPEPLSASCFSASPAGRNGGITGAAVTAMIGHLTLTPQGRAALEALLAKDG
jgi:hypothetical protein